MPAPLPARRDVGPDPVIAEARARRYKNMTYEIHNTRQHDGLANIASGSGIVTVPRSTDLPGDIGMHSVQDSPLQHSEAYEYGVNPADLSITNCLFVQGDHQMTISPHQFETDPPIQVSSKRINHMWG